MSSQPPSDQPPPPPPPPAAPPPGAPPPPTGAGYAAPALPNNQNALIALILGIAVFFTCGISAPFAIWLARRAKREIAASNGTQGGDGMATAGMVLGIVGLVFLVLFVIYIVFVVMLGIFAGVLSTTTRSY